MRRTIVEGPSKLYDNHEQFMGYSLGFDFCAEHEWGMSDLSIMVGCRGKKWPKSAKVNIPKNQDFILFEKNEEACALTVGKGIEWFKVEEGSGLHLCFALHSYYPRAKDKNMSAWDRKGFQLVADKDEFEDMELLYNEMLKSNAAICLLRDKNNPFSNPSMLVTIWDRFEQRVKEDQKKEKENKENVCKGKSEKETNTPL